MLLRVRKSILFGMVLHLYLCKVWVEKISQEGKGKNEKNKRMEDEKSEEMHGGVNGNGVGAGRSANVCWNGGDRKSVV